MLVNEFLALKKRMEGLNGTPIPSKTMQQVVNELREGTSTLCYTGSKYIEVWLVEEDGVNDFNLYLSSPQQYKDKVEANKVAEVEKVSKELKVVLNKLKEAEPKKWEAGWYTPTFQDYAEDLLELKKETENWDKYTKMEELKTSYPDTKSYFFDEYKYITNIEYGLLKDKADIKSKKKIVED